MEGPLSMEEPGKPDWIDWVVKAAAFFGANPVRLRWKLLSWRDSMGRAKNRGQSTVEHITYEHKVCPHCGSLQDKGRKVCSDCGKGLSPRFWEILRRLGFTLPKFGSVTGLITAVCVAAYVRLVVYQGGGGLMSFDIDTLMRFGAHYPPYVWAGQWWRLSTAILLHAGLWHILFNLMALQQIGPTLEEIFGRGRILFYFMVTGILANVGSEILGLHAPAIGASGALMGLMGLAAGWGQKDGSPMGRNVRDLMVKWTLYTIVFGFMIGADNGAHISGFVCGGVIGLIAKPSYSWSHHNSLWVKIQTFLGAVLFAGTALLVFFPPVG